MINQQEFTELVLHQVCKMERESTREIRASVRSIDDWFVILRNYVRYGTVTFDAVNIPNATDQPNQ